MNVYDELYAKCNRNNYRSPIVYKHEKKNK